jgi:hypothetical protein
MLEEPNHRSSNVLALPWRASPMILSYHLSHHV